MNKKTYFSSLILISLLVTACNLPAHFGMYSLEATQTPGQGISATQYLPSPNPIPATPALPTATQPPEYVPAGQFLLPDSEVVNSPCGRNFDIQEFVQAAGGVLSTYTQEVEGQRLSGSEVVKLVAENTSINPHLLLAWIESRSQWVLGNPETPNWNHPLGLDIANQEGLYKELAIYAQLVNIGYYGWRQGSLSELTFLEGGTARITPELNAGSVAVQYLFARSSRQAEWQDKLYGPNGFQAIYHKMFGDPMVCARNVEPLFPEGMQIPTLELPFTRGEGWALTGGLHNDWDVGTPLGALDFAPITGETPCAVSRAWVRASAAGIVTRAEFGVLQLALVDSSGKPTGWELRYMHIAVHDRAAVGTRLATDDPLGHPSCEGGAATGTHVHLARLYRGEWIGAGNPFPYILSGWLAMPGRAPYQSTLVKGDKVVTAHSDGSYGSTIIR